jgi:hypothetical protein
MDTDGLLVERVGDELLVYDTESDEAHQLAPQAATSFERAAATGMSRRDALRRAAIVGAVAGVPLVKSIVAPTPAAAGTFAVACREAGESCTASTQCCGVNVCLGTNQCGPNAPGGGGIR